MSDADSYNSDHGLYDQLVAYLDGELDAERSLQVERRLAEDEGFRRELLQLQGVWDALDELPLAEVDESFTQTTVEMVVLSAEHEFEEEKNIARIRSRRWWQLGACCLAVAALASFWVTHRTLTRPNRQLLHDLPVIEDIDRYRVADSLEYLHLLKESKLFDDDEEVEDALQ